jgi:Domain of unknown function (DUF4926)
MTGRIEPLDVVVLTAGLPQHGVVAGSLAVVLEVHEHPHLAYEVEVVDAEGRTIFLGAVDPAQVELRTKGASSGGRGGGGGGGNPDL